MERICLNCRESLGPGRPDRKFCDHQCRSIYHYEHTPDNDTIVRTITRILRKNRKILLELNINSNTKVTRKQLADKGFDFGYYTSMIVSDKMERYYYCFDIGYFLVNDEMVLLFNECNLIKTEPERSCKSATTNQRYKYVQADQLPCLPNCMHR